MSTTVRVKASVLMASVAAIVERLGVETSAARRVADALVEADLEGVPSHGVMLLPMYAERLRKGSISPASAGVIVGDDGGCVVLDARHILGQLSADQAVEIAATRARQHGVGVVAVRNAFHFGMAGRYARALARAGCVGIVACNTRPLMPAVGGAERVVGNNPLAIAVPTAGDIPAEVDMATSASAMGKIRLAEAAGQPIPAGGAVDADGRPTTDAAAAIKGMLLPAAGPKGFGLAFMLDLLCGGLSGGAVGDAVRPLYGDPAEPYNCAHFFLALDVGHFQDLEAFAGRAAEAAARVRRSRPAPGVDRVYSPGELNWATRRDNAATCPIERAVLDDVLRTARSVGADISELSPISGGDDR